jgi:anti-sigma factor RsiW
MLSCEEAEPYIAHAVDGGALDEDRRAALDAHLERCETCRTAFETQRLVAAWLRQRPSDRVSPDFIARLSERLDEAAGWFGIADWRLWTLRLAPLAAVLALAILFGGSTAERSVTIDEWAYQTNSGATPLWQADVSAESALESLLTGEQPAASGEGNGAGRGPAPGPGR